MANFNRDANDEPDSLDQVLASLLKQLENGQLPDEDDWVCRYPDHAAEIREFLSNHARMRAHTPIDETIPADEEPATKNDSSQAKTAGIDDKIVYLGNYRLIEELGRGGMGVVYRARQSNLNRDVAVKMILSGQFASQEDLQRFTAEAQAVAKLDHPGIVSVYELGSHGAHHYFSMALVEGESLSGMLERGKLSPRKAAELTVKIADAIEYAHQQGVIHRDLKPANVLIDQDGMPRITDFGLARSADREDLTETGQILGTPAYMPPEQARGSQRPGPTADVYSIGAMLYEMLTGKPPFRGDTPIETLFALLENDPLPPRLIDKTIPQDLQTICLKCLEKNPKRRYHTAADLADDLRRHLSGDPILARGLSRAEKVLFWTRKRSKRFELIGASVIASLLALVLIGALISRWNDSRSGLVEFTTTGKPLRAEFLSRESDRVIGDPFTIPNEQPIKIPAGHYRLRVTGPHAVSRLFVIEIIQSELSTFDVELHDPHLWKHETSNRSRAPRMIEIDGRVDVIAPTADGNARIHGETGEVLWICESSDVDIPSTFRRMIRVVSDPTHQSSDNILSVRPFERTKPIQLIEGATGKLIWEYPAPKIDGHPARLVDAVVVPRTESIGPALIAAFVHDGTSQWVVVGCRTGTSEWESDIELPIAADDWYRLQPEIPRHWTGENPRSDIHLHAYETAQGEQVVGILGRNVVAVRLQDGQPVWQPFTIPSTPIASTLDRYGGMLRVATAGHGLIVIDPRSGRIVDDCSLDSEEFRSDETAWRCFADVENNGKHDALYLAKRAGSMRVSFIDGDHNQEAWSLDYDVYPFQISGSTGPDIDHDGHDDVFIAFVDRPRGRLYPLNLMQLRIDAVSSQSGEFIWTQYYPLPEFEYDAHIDSICWAALGSDRWPQLAVTVSGGAPNLQAMVVMTNASDGSSFAFIDDAFCLDTLDADGDGHRDLLCRGIGSTSSTFLLPGEAPIVWSYLGRLGKTADLNSDGIDDLSDQYSETRYSGADGSLFVYDPPGRGNAWKADIRPPLPRFTIVENTLLAKSDLGDQALWQLSFPHPIVRQGRHDFFGEDPLCVVETSGASYLVNYEDGSIQGSYRLPEESQLLGPVDDDYTRLLAWSAHSDGQGSIHVVSKQELGANQAVPGDLAPPFQHPLRPLPWVANMSNIQFVVALMICAAFGLLYWCRLPWTWQFPLLLGLFVVVDYRLLGVAGMYVAMSLFFLGLVGDAAENRLRALVVILVGSLVCSPIVGIAWIAFDLLMSNEAAGYDWGGWYFIFTYGVILLAVVGVILDLVRRSKTWPSRSLEWIWNPLKATKSTKD